MVAEIIDFVEFKKGKQKVDGETAIKVKAFRKVTENLQSDSTKYNHDFYCLVDLFMQENYPDYAVRFDLFLEKLTKENKNG